MGTYCQLSANPGMCRDQAEKLERETRLELATSTLARMVPDPLSALIIGEIDQKAKAQKNSNKEEKHK
jgi:hypothetical protein